MILNRQNLSEYNWNSFKIVAERHHNCQLSIVNCQFGEALQIPICLSSKRRINVYKFCLYIPVKGDYNANRDMPCGPGTVRMAGAKKGGTKNGWFW